MKNNIKMAMEPTISEKIKKAGVIAVLVIDNPDHAAPLAEALSVGGVDIIELTLRTPAAFASAEIIKNAFPEITLGFGTVLTEKDVQKAVDTGADFAVSPGCNPRILKAANKAGLSFAPGISTPTDIEIALENHCNVMKFFPAETSGGLPHLKSMAAPYQHLGVKFIPLGGLNTANADKYITSPLVSAIGGSWIASRNLINDQNWQQITQNAKEIREMIESLRSGL